MTLNLANLMLAVKSWKDGESYYDSAEKLATAQLNAPTKILCLENRGVCQDMQGNARAAAESWEAGATLAKATEESQLQKRVLGVEGERVDERCPSATLTCRSFPRLPGARARGRRR